MSNLSRRAASNSSSSNVRHASDFRPAPMQVNDRRASSSLLDTRTANDDNAGSLRDVGSEGNNPLERARRESTLPLGQAITTPRVMGSPRKARRSIEQVLQSCPTVYDEAAYALQRIAANDLRTQKVLNTVSSEALPLIIEQRPDLARFFKN